MDAFMRVVLAYVERFLLWNDESRFVQSYAKGRCVQKKMFGSLLFYSFISLKGQLQHFSFSI